MLGSGIFVLPGIAVTVTGPSLWLSYFLAALCILPAAISKAELATAMPTSGGTYVYIERTFGPMAGTIVGLGLFVSLLLKSAFSLMGFGAYLSVLTSFDLKTTAFISLFVITSLNMIGVGKVSSILLFIVTICITCLFTLSAFSVQYFEPAHLEPFMTNGVSGLLGATAMVFVSFAGVTKVAAIAEEIKDPEKNLPLSILLSLLIITLVYVAVNFSLVSALGPQRLAGDLKPLYHLAKFVFGDGKIATFGCIVAIITMISMANSGILAASRFPFAMSRDNLLPKRLGRISRKTLTPIYSILLSGFLIALSIGFLNIEKIVKLASAFMILIFVFVNISVIVLREARVQWYEPSYKSPMYPYIQLFGIISGIALLFTTGKNFLIAFSTTSIVGVLFYTFYARKRTNRKGVIGIRGKRKDLTEEDTKKLQLNTFKNRDFNIGGELEANVVVSLFGTERSPEMLIEMGAALSDGGNLEVTHVTEVPEQTDLLDIIDEPAELISLRRRVVAMAMDQKISITFDPVVSHDIGRTLFQVSQRFHCNWMLIEWSGKKRGYFTIHNPIGWLKGHLKCHLGIFRDSGVRYIRKILTLIKFDENDRLVLETADHLAKRNNADITLVHYISEDSNLAMMLQIENNMIEMGKRLRSRSSSQVIHSRVKSDSLIAYTVEFDLLIFGSAEHKFLNKIRETDDDRLLGKSACSVLSVNTSK
ncbi:MAG: amino acid permease [Bacteriovoracaceae bacterium]|jgi:basic amino acid/polyamine antiporter, APA family|nr:amino acid permease [Bacteriovoracaceae bacterium]